LKRQVASKHDSRDYIDRIQSSCKLQLDVPRSAQVDIIEPDDGITFIVVDGRYTFVKQGESFIPYVGSAHVTDLLPAARIDDGAIKYILKGADVMRPGIAKYDEWGGADRLVVVRDEAKGRALAVGKSLVESAEMAKMTKGICIKNVHHAGDRVWDAFKKI